MYTYVCVRERIRHPVPEALSEYPLCKILGRLKLHTTNPSPENPLVHIGALLFIMAFSCILHHQYLY